MPFSVISWRGYANAFQYEVMYNLEARLGVRSWECWALTPWVCTTSSPRRCRNDVYPYRGPKARGWLIRVRWTCTYNTTSMSRLKRYSLARP